MKTDPFKTFLQVLAVALLLCFIAACDRAPSNTGSPVNGGDLAGTWQSNGQPCRIAQSGQDLLFINERGGQSRGRIQDKSTVVATDWEGGLVGELSSNKKIISWRNHTVWVRPK